MPLEDRRYSPGGVRFHHERRVLSPGRGMFCYLTSQVTLDLTSEETRSGRSSGAGKRVHHVGDARDSRTRFRDGGGRREYRGQRLLTNNLFQLVVILGVRPALHDRGSARGRHFVRQCRAKARVLTGAAGAPRQK